MLAVDWFCVVAEESMGAIEEAAAAAKCAADAPDALKALVKAKCVTADGEAIGDGGRVDLDALAQDVAALVGAELEGNAGVQALDVAGALAVACHRRGVCAKPSE